MKEMTYFIQVSGYIHIILGLMHIPFFWKKLFKEWEESINILSLLHFKLINTLLLVVTLILLSIGILLLIYSEAIARNAMNLLWFWGGMSLFWWWRTLWQTFYFYQINIRKSKIYLKMLTITMIASFFANALIFSKPIFRILG